MSMTINMTGQQVINFSKKIRKRKTSFVFKIF